VFGADEIPRLSTITAWSSQRAQWWIELEKKYHVQVGPSGKTTFAISVSEAKQQEFFLQRTLLDLTDDYLSVLFFFSSSSLVLLLFVFLLFSFFHGVAVFSFCDL
jgi:hypothetical protein